MMMLSSILSFGIFIFGVTYLVFQQHETHLKKLETQNIFHLKQKFSKEFLFMNASHLRHFIRILLAVSLIVSVAYFSIIPLIVGMLLVFMVPNILLKFVQQRRRKLFYSQLPNLLLSLSSILRAGHTFERALETLSSTQSAPMSQELQFVIKEMRLGVPLITSFKNLLSRFPGRDLEMLIRAIDLSHRVGSNLAEALENVSQTIQHRLVVRDRLMSATAQGRTQAWVTMLLPIFLVGILHIVSPNYLHPLTKTVEGRWILFGCFLALIIGMGWIHKISHQKVIV